MQILFDGVVNAGEGSLSFMTVVHEAGGKASTLKSWQLLKQIVWVDFYIAL